MTDTERIDQVALCSGMTERIRTSRLDHLDLAAKAGVMGADSAFLLEGPFGDPSALVSRPSDPLVMAWKQQAITQLTTQAANADVGSLINLYHGYLNGSNVVEKNPELALTYGRALREIFNQFKGLPASMNPYSEESLLRIESELSQDQVAAAAIAANDRTAPAPMHQDSSFSLPTVSNNSINSGEERTIWIRRFSKALSSSLIGLYRGNLRILAGKSGSFWLRTPCPNQRRLALKTQKKCRQSSSQPGKLDASIGLAMW
jgi:hypothetical protein